MEDKPVQCFVGSRSAWDNLKLIPDGQLPVLPRLADVYKRQMMNVAPLEALSRIARRQGVPLIIDNTFATPALCRPIEWLSLIHI